MKLRGYLSAREVAEVLRASDAIPGPWHVDADELLGVDASGLALLHSLKRRGIEIHGLSHSLALRLQDEAWF